MNLKDLKEWVESLPEEFSDYKVVIKDNNEEGDYVYIDKTLVSANVDKENKLIVFYI